MSKPHGFVQFNGTSHPAVQFAIRKTTCQWCGNHHGFGQAYDCWSTPGHDPLDGHDPLVMCQGCFQIGDHDHQESNTSTGASKARHTSMWRIEIRRAAAKARAHRNASWCISWRESDGRPTSVLCKMVVSPGLLGALHHCPRSKRWGNAKLLELWLLSFDAMAGKSISVILVALLVIVLFSWRQDKGSIVARPPATNWCPCWVCCC